MYSIIRTSWGTAWGSSDGCYESVTGEIVASSPRVWDSETLRAYVAYLFIARVFLISLWFLVNVARKASFTGCQEM